MERCNVKSPSEAKKWNVLSSEGKALRLLRTNSSKTTFEDNITECKRRLQSRGYPDNLSEKIISEVKFSERLSALQNKQKTRKNILLFVTEYRPYVPNLKSILMKKWHLIENQPVLREIFKDSPILSYRKGRSLKDTVNLVISPGLIQLRKGFWVGL